MLLAPGVLTLNVSVDKTVATTISGPGGLEKTGNASLSLTGANTYTGSTVVGGRTLSMNGSLTSNVTVLPGGSLGGNGTIDGNVVVQGTLAPGNSIGTLGVRGNFTQAAGSTYAVEVNAAGRGIF